MLFSIQPWRVAAALAFAAGAAAGNTNIVIFPPPPGLAASTRFAVQVNVDAAWSNSYVNFNPDRASVAGTGPDMNQGKSFNWTTFETSSAAVVRVQRLTGGFNTCVVRPSRFGITPVNVGNNTVQFVVQPGQKISVEFDSDICPNFPTPPYGVPCVTNILMIFADSLPAMSTTNGILASDIFLVTPGSNVTNVVVSGASPPIAGQSTLGTAGGKKVVVFTPGVYDIGYWQVPNNVAQVYIAGGAVVYGAIDVLPQGYSPSYNLTTISNVYTVYWQQALQPAFKLAGPGILSGEKLPWHLRKDFIYDSTDNNYWALVKQLQLGVATSTVMDVTLDCPPYWSISYMNDADGRSQGTFDNFKIVGAWCYNNDGIPNPTGTNSVIRNAFIHADDDSFKLYNNGSSISNCVVWQNNGGAVFQMGWYAKTASNISVSAIDVIHEENWWGAGGNLAVFDFGAAAGPGTISNYRFANVNVEGNILRLFGLDTLGSAQIIRNFSFNTLTVGGMGAGYLGSPPTNNFFNGVVTNWAFTNLVIGGTNITTLAMATNLAMFQFYNGAGTGFTFGAGMPPVIANNGGATAVGTAAATLNGLLVSTGSAATVGAVCWGTVDYGTSTNGWDHVGNLGTCAAGALSTNVTGLSSNTLYYYRYYASNAWGVAWASPAAAFNTTTSAVVAGGSSSTALWEFKFNETGTICTNTGTAGTSATSLQMKNTSYGTAADLRGAAGSGVSGLAGDKALNLSGINYTGGYFTNSGSVNGPLLDVPYANCTTIENLPQMTFSGWFNVQAAISNNTYANNGTLLLFYSYQKGIEVSFTTANSSQNQMCVNLNAAQLFFNITPIMAFTATNQWFFWAVTYDGTLTANNLNLYMGTTTSNVTLAGTQSANQGTLVTPNSGYNFSLNLGAENSNGGTLKGFMDDVRIDNTVLAQSDLETRRKQDANVTSAPVVSNAAATNVLNTSAWMNGSLTSTGSAPTSVWVYFDTADHATNKTWTYNHAFGVQSVGALSQQVKSLPPNTRLFYTYYASNAVGDAWATPSMTCKTWGAPGVDNSAGASLVGETTATLNGTLTNGVSALVVMLYGTNQNNWAFTNNLGTVSEGAFSLPVTGLLPGTTYWYLCYATNAYGSALTASNAAFTTLPAYVPVANWFVDPAGTNGAPANGSSGNPWKTIAYAINHSSIGDVIFLKAGAVFNEQVNIGAANSGTTSRPLTLLSDPNNRATITAPATNNNAVSIWNASNVSLQNLRLAGQGLNTNQMDGVLVSCNDAGHDNITLSNCEITGFGLYGLEFSGWGTTASGFRTVQVSNCAMHDNRRGGISADAQTSGAHQNVVISSCQFYNNPGDPAYSSGSTGMGVVLGEVTGGLIQNCVAYNNGSNCSVVIGPVGIMVYDSANVIIQSCESYSNHTVSGSTDGDGFDLDGGCQNCTVQYCYSHDNAGAGYLACQYNGARAYTNNVFRYNISQNDGGFLQYGGLMFYSAGSSGGLANTKIYGNTIYNAVSSAVNFFNTAGQSGTWLGNNIFITANGQAVVNGNPGTAIAKFEHNLYWCVGGPLNLAGQPTLAAWQGATGQEMIGALSVGLNADPLLSKAGGGGTLGNPALLPTLGAYTLQAASPCINSGATIVSPGSRDFYGLPVPRNGAFNLGAYNGACKFFALFVR